MINFFTRNEISFGWIIWFSLCMLPLYLSSFSVNYLFVVTPIIYLMAGGRLSYPTTLIKIYFILCALVFLGALSYQVQYIDYFIRRAISFLLFISIFTLPLINFSKKKVNSFLISIVIVSVILSVQSIQGMITSNVIDPATLKALIGSQRTGIIHLFAFFILSALVLDENKRKHLRLTSFLMIIIVLIGIALTFSRSTYIALLAGLFSCFIYYFIRLKIRMRWVKLLSYSLFFGLLTLFAIIIFYPQYIIFLEQRLFVLLNIEFLLETISLKESSEGYRIALWLLILDFVLKNPLTGSGFLGSWVLSDWSGSSHSEFIDRFLRLGMIGFSFYIILILRILKFLINYNKSLGFAFLSAIVYGFMHETFSLGHGAVIFSFLLSLYVSSSRGGFKYEPQHVLTKR